ncbi:hypothetical protein QBC33DRAFT_593208 [Phialemonium atrogriseum]|uniref:Nephrocystin 3-like N-terminal domain-containing protein n=1 Tax=Phialemonium atrogriseum TaxID=1093897 RepID=A0AAJ0BWD4_9PEZI|nr:uncharacterized protein QBC33DRAFT_593208 [Phialemonium atrogriseum]KAK1765197.1 hypothetical protein QBC33DRAFT_593208 [Phialemonium atrogriseum]
MAEAVAGLSLAATILQVLDFGKQFLCAAWAIYRSRAEGIDLLSDLQSITNDFDSVLGELEGGAARDRALRSAKGDDDGIFLLAEKCAAVLSEMLQSLAKIGAPGKGRKRDAVKTAFKLAWKKDDIETLQKRLEQFRDELNLHLVFSLRLWSAPYTTDRKYQTIHRLRTFISRIVGERCYSKIIARLYYRGMQDREHGILQAHEKTFRWVFEDSGQVSVPWSDLKEWLASDNAIYWITGKAGSGKSTLMRYISQPIPNPGEEETMAILPSPMTHQPRCAQYLNKWAGDELPLIMASFYFWAAGSSKTQTSQAGLFRSILYQLLKASLESIPVIAPSRWEALSLFNEDPRDFTEGELGETLCRAVKHIAATSKVALFVDGLDEFEGNPGTLIAIIRRLTSSSPIKMCVSSRPWAEFEDEFRSKPNLRLEDLTQSDIKNYVAAKLHENTYFAQLQATQGKVAEQLIGSIVEKASGVFLWVQLVVASLLEGLRNGDRVEDLARAWHSFLSSWKTSTEGFWTRLTHYTGNMPRSTSS